MKIYNIGSLNIDYVYSVDHFVRPGETISSFDMKIFPGGKGLNQSVALARAGADVSHGAKIGADGNFLLDTLSESGVKVEKIEQTDKSSGHAIIQVDKSGQNCILLFSGTNHSLDREYIENFLSDSEENDILLIQNETNALDIIFEIAKRKNLQLAFNPSPLGENIQSLPLENVKWWFCNEIESEALFGSSEPEEITENFIKKYPESNLILTLGKNGSMYKDKNECVYQPIFEAKTVDTTAAGDTFTGYFLTSIIDGKTPAEALKIASKASSIAVSREGASSSIPYKDELKGDL